MQEKEKVVSRVKPLGTIQQFGADVRMLTLRGWIIIPPEDIEEELKEIKSLCST